MVRSPAVAIAWEFRQRHRWGLIALAGYLVVLAAIKLRILGSGQPVHVETPEHFALVVMVPLTTTFMYFLAVFSFGLAGDLAARQSMYPARLFTLPVTTAALAGWPMLYGTGAMALLWLATRLLAVWPSGVDVPVVWPALGAAALLAWTQALTWMPYGLRGLRVIVAVLWLGVLDSIVLLAIQYNAREPVMLAILAPQVPLAYLVARFAVARARRGDVPDWRGVFAWLGRIADVLPSRRDHFSSPARAQTWFEWRRHGRSLPAWVGILLPFELALLFVTGDTPALVFAVLAGVLVLGAIPVALRWSGTWSVVVEHLRGATEHIGTPRVVVIVLLIVSGLIAATWKQLVQSLYVGLTGREWLIKGSVFVTLALLFLIGPIAQWIIDNESVQRALWDALPLILAMLVGLKMSAAAWIATRLYRRRLLSDRALVVGAACWCVAVLALYAVLVWFFSTPFVARYVLALIAILAVPLARLSAAPLALAWNRHR